MVPQSSHGQRDSQTLWAPSTRLCLATGSSLRGSGWTQVSPYPVHSSHTPAWWWCSSRQSTSWVPLAFQDKQKRRCCGLERQTGECLQQLKLTMAPKELTTGKWTLARESLIVYMKTQEQNMSEIKVIKTSYVANIYGTRSTRSYHTATYNCSAQPVLKQRQVLNPDDSKNYGRIEINHCQLLKRYIKPACPQEEPRSVGMGFTINTLNNPCKEPCANYLYTVILELGHPYFFYTCLGACGYETVGV